MQLSDRDAPVRARLVIEHYRRILINWPNTVNNKRHQHPPKKQEVFYVYMIFSHYTCSDSNLKYLVSLNTIGYLLTAIEKTMFWWSQIKC